MQDYQIIDNKIYPKVDPIDPDQLRQNKANLIASIQKSQQDIAGFQTQVDAIDAVLNQLPV